MSQTEVQLIKDAVIVNADVSNSAAIDVSKISGALPAAGGTITGDVTFDGETAGRDIVFDRSDNALEFADDAKIKFGSSGDLEIFHDASHSRIVDGGTGGLKIQSNALAIDNAAGTETMAAFTEDGSVQLRFNNSTKLETVTTGIQVTGNVRTNGISQSSGNLSVSNNDTINGVITVATNTNDCWRFEFNGDFEPHVDNNVNIGSSSKRAANVYAVNFHGNGSNLTGISSVGGDTGVKFNDDVNITLGTGNDTLIRHVAGSHTEIDHVGTGDLVLETVNGGDDILLNSNDDVFIQHAGEDMAVFRSDAQVELYHNNIKAIETFDTGDAGDSGNTEGSGVKTIGNTSGGTRSNHGYYCYQGSNLVALLANHGSGPEGKLHLFNQGVLKLSLNGTNGTIKFHDGGNTNLDHYETGSYTPVVGGFNTGNCVASTAEGSYVRIGDLCTAHINYSTTNFNAVSGNEQLFVTLPFTAISSQNRQGTLCCAVWSIGSQNISWMGGEVHTNNNAARICYHNGGNNNTNNGTANNFNNQLQFTGTVTFRTA